MSNVALAVPSAISRRSERLARDAGRTRAQMLKFVLRNGLEHAEYTAKEVNSGLEELNAGKGIPLAAVKQRAADRTRQRVARGLCFCPNWRPGATSSPRTYGMPPRPCRAATSRGWHQCRRWPD